MSFSCDTMISGDVVPCNISEPFKNYIKWTALLCVGFTYKINEDINKREIVRTHVIKWMSKDKVRYKQVKSALDDIVFYHCATNIKDGDIINIEKYNDGTIACYKQDDDFERMYGSGNKK